MKVFCSLVVVLISSITFAFTSSQSTEVVIRFDHWVELPEWSHNQQIAKAVIADQLGFLFGYLNYAELGAPKQDADIQNVEIEKASNGTYIARYTYEGTFALRKSAVSRLTLALPNNPETIYNVSESRKKGNKNPCTDEQYPLEGSFWYFWSPDRPGCQNILSEGEDFTVIKPQVKALAHPDETYPEYSRLVNSQGRIEISILIGKNEFNRLRSPEKQSGEIDDLNAKTFRKLDKALSDMGFEGRVWKTDEVKEIVKQPLKPFPFVKEFTYSYPQGPAREISVRLVYSNANLDHQTRGLRSFFKDSMEKSSVMIYDGHSGFGSNLDDDGVGRGIPEEFRPRLVKGKYQIYFFNSCSSYAFYNFDFFKMKPSADLDIFTAGLETPFLGGEQSELSLISAIHRWAQTGHSTSYQQLVKQMDNGNLIGVNGDQDNPRP